MKARNRIKPLLTLCCALLLGGCLLLIALAVFAAAKYRR